MLRNRLFLEVKNVFKICILYKNSLNEIITHTFHTSCSILLRDYAKVKPVRGLFDNIIIHTKCPLLYSPFPLIKANIRVFPGLTQ